MLTVILRQKYYFLLSSLLYEVFSTIFQFWSHWPNSVAKSRMVTFNSLSPRFVWSCLKSVSRCRFLKSQLKFLRATPSLSPTWLSTTNPFHQLRHLESVSRDDRVQGPRQVRIDPLLTYMTAAKNNSDYIYYSKFNESGVESSSKNGSTKRKYTQRNPDSKKYDGAKSAKSNSFHVPRISQKPISEKNQLAGYPVSCCEDLSPSITSNSGNLGISNPEFSHDPLVKGFN